MYKKENDEFIKKMNKEFWKDAESNVLKLTASIYACKDTSKKSELLKEKVKQQGLATFYKNKVN